MSLSPAPKPPPHQAILASLVYVLSADSQHVLMVHRNRRPDDLHLGKYNGLGGKFEPDESARQCAIREVQEEAGITLTALELRGTIHWPGFGRHGENWFGFVWLATAYEGTAATECPEGDLEWIERERLLELPLWESDRLFLPLVFDGQPEQFHGVMPFAAGKMISWNVSR